MSVFSPTNDPSRTTGQVVQNAVFWPDVQVDAFRAAVRLQDTVTDGRVVHALRDAIIGVNGELREWRDRQLVLGYTELGSVPSDDYGPLTALEHHYLTAVYAQAKALLIEYYKDTDVTEQGLRRFIQWTDSADVYRREAREALRALLGVPRATVELI